MVSQKIRKIQLKLLFLYLILFPFGQLIKIKAFHPTDFIVGLMVVLFIFTKQKKYPKNLKYLISTIIVFICSLLFSRAIFNFNNIWVAGLYLIRFCSYSIFYLIIFDQVSYDKKLKNTLLNSLIALGVLVSILGLIQYFLLPDVRSLYYLGWDDHYFRLISTFLDPAFTGIILVLTDILLISKIQVNKKLILPAVLVTIAILLTYSRSSYIALVFGNVFYLIAKNKKLIILSFLALVFVTIPFLPRPGSEGVKLERINSIILKIENYKDSYLIISKSPLFGVGFNNICEAKKIFLKTIQNPDSHSCSGLDNSFLFILASSGVVGFISFLNFGYKLIKVIEKKYLSLGYSIILAIIIHSLFTNTLFYPWVMGWLAIFFGSVSSFTKRKN